jgi:NAD(P)-dependent dehydrogenase (short-subunit alcohol dehydrogenase family)
MIELTSVANGSLFDLEGRVAVVTGASGGLGARFAATLAAAGATVVACARRLEPLERLAAEHDHIEAARCDVADDAQARALVEGVLARHGRIDVCVNNAGISSGGPDQQGSVDAFSRVIDVNVRAVFALSQLVAAPMLDRGRGSIVNVSSMFGLVASSPAPDAGYVASKAAINGLTRELGAQWARRGVRVNAIAPGWFVTEINDQYLTGEAGSQLKRDIPMGRFGETGDLDGALLLLASNAGRYITGTTVVVDGGQVVALKG